MGLAQMTDFGLFFSQVTAYATRKWISKYKTRANHRPCIAYKGVSQPKASVDLFLLMPWVAQNSTYTSGR